MSTIINLRRIAALYGFGAVAMGAFGAHALKAFLSDHGTTATWETAVRYQMWHALAILLCLAITPHTPTHNKAAGCFAAGTALFSPRFDN